MRLTRYPIDERLRRRYSPKTFTDTAITEEELYAVLEAGITAPSSYNEQPWRFVLGKGEDFHTILAEGNRVWADAVQTFVLMCAKPTFMGHPNRDGSPRINDKAIFDTGTCFGFMQIEGMNRGIFMHPMGGFSVEKAREIFDMEDLEPICVIAMGKAAEAEEYTPRRNLEEFILQR
ncbi:MAG: nitroreductase family protein [Sulfuricurvum sp.]